MDLGQMLHWLRSRLLRITASKPVAPEPPTTGSGLGPHSGKRYEGPPPPGDIPSGAFVIALCVILLAAPAHAAKWGGSLTGREQQVGGGGGGSLNNYVAQNKSPPRPNQSVTETFGGWLSDAAGWFTGPKTTLGQVDYSAPGYGIGTTGGMDPESRGSGVTCC